ncbi:SulP family inorganic anion transporter [uncultured Nevskia sp.]|uniref:SulP family inorganic anion transporter n=1 Tax=uncultured Nevskia sp. TaxID=228950 RepID=UPI0025D4D527|nr:sulfate permease [uncultured Nevskia sp.]
MSTTTRSKPGRGLLPLLDDLRGGDRAQFTQDGIAGTITAILLIPQALAYALLAGLPPEVGLYASVLPVLVYALLGSSRTLAVGPVAVAAVMVAAALTPYAGGDPAKYLSGALILSALSGAILLAMAALRLGWLTHFISHPVLAGFTTGAALFIIGTQLSGLSGIPVPRDVQLDGILLALFKQRSALDAETLAFGLSAIVLLLAARRPLVGALGKAGIQREHAVIIGRTAPLLLVIAATLIAAAFDAHGRWGVAVVGDIPKGIPALSLDFLTQDGWRVLLAPAAMIAVIGYVESISVAKALAFRRNEKIDPDQELMALGATNLIAACAGAMPVAGGFARSMVNFDAGARTQLAAVITALWVALAAALFTGLLASLPKAVLAAIIVVAVWQLVDFKHLRHTWRYDRGDGAAQAATIAGVLLAGVETGLMIGAGLSLLLFLYRTSRPHIAVVGQLGATEHFRNVRRFEVRTWPGVVMLRIDETLYFANAPRVESELQAHIVEADRPHDVVLIMSGVAYVDTSGLEVLETLEQALRQAGGRLHLAEVKGPVMDRLAGTDLLARLGRERVHLSAHDAARAIENPILSPPIPELIR